MSQIVDDLRQVAIEIKTETQVGGNTAARVGGAFERVADALEGTQQIEDMDAAVAAVQQAAAENEQTIQDIVNSLAVVQTTGQSASDVMSQKAVTDAILQEASISDIVRIQGIVNGATGVISSATTNFFSTIPIPQGADTVNFQTIKTAGTNGVCFINSNGTYISGYYNRTLNAGTRVDVKIPNGATHFRYCYSTDASASQQSIPFFDYITFKWHSTSYADYKDNVLDEKLQSNINENTISVNGEVKVENLDQNLLGVNNATTGVVSISTGNFYADIDIPNGADFVNFRTIKTAGTNGCTFFDKNGNIVGSHYNGTVNAGTRVNVAIPAVATIFRYCYNTDASASQQSIPVCDYVSFSRFSSNTDGNLAAVNTFNGLMPLNVATEFENGNIHGSTGAEYPSNDVLRSKTTFSLKAGCTIKIVFDYEGMRFAMPAWKNGTYIGRVIPFANNRHEATYTATDDITYRILVAREDTAWVTPFDLNGYVLTTHTTNNAVEKIILQNTFSNGWVVTEDKWLGGLVSSMDFDDDGNAYLGCLGNQYEAAEGGEPILSIFNLNNPNVFENYQIAPRNTVLEPFGNTGNSPYDGVAKILEGTSTLKCLWFDLANPRRIGVRNFDMTTRTFEAGARIINIKIPVISGGTWDGSSYTTVQATTSNTSTIRTAFNKAFGMEIFSNPEDALIFNSGIVYDGTYYYNSIGFGLGTHPIMRSSDMETWEYVTDIPITHGQSENPLFYKNGYLYTISRINCYLSRYDIANDTWTQLHLGDQGADSASRGAIAVYDGYIYAIQTWGSPTVNGDTVRRGLNRIFRINLDLSGYKSLDWVCDQGGNYYVLGVNGTSMYTSVGLDRRQISRGFWYGARAGVVFNHVDYGIKNLFD